MTAPKSLPGYDFAVGRVMIPMACYAFTATLEFLLGQHLVKPVMILLTTLGDLKCVLQHHLVRPVMVWMAPTDSMTFVYVGFKHMNRHVTMLRMSTVLCLWNAAMKNPRLLISARCKRLTVLEALVLGLQLLASFLHACVMTVKVDYIHRYAGSASGNSATGRVVHFQGTVAKSPANRPTESPLCSSATCPGSIAQCGPDESLMAPDPSHHSLSTSASPLPVRMLRPWPRKQHRLVTLGLLAAGNPILVSASPVPPDRPHSDSAVNTIVFVSCFAMVLSGFGWSVYAWSRKEATTFSYRYVWLFGMISVVASAAWTAILYTVDTDNDLRYLAVGFWCMTVTAFISESYTCIRDHQRHALALIPGFTMAFHLTKLLLNQHDGQHKMLLWTHRLRYEHVPPAFTIWAVFLCWAHHLPRKDHVSPPAIEDGSGGLELSGFGNPPADAAPQESE